MFCGMALTTVRRGREDDLIRAAVDHAEALRQQPGCVATYVLRERGTASQVSLSFFESEEAFRRGAKATLPVIAKHHLDELLEGPPTFRFFDVR